MKINFADIGDSIEIRGYALVESTIVIKPVNEMSDDDQDNLVECGCELVENDDVTYVVVDESIEPESLGAIGFKGFETIVVEGRKPFEKAEDEDKVEESDDEDEDDDEKVSESDDDEDEFSESDDDEDEDDDPKKKKTSKQDEIEESVAYEFPVGLVSMDEAEKDMDDMGLSSTISVQEGYTRIDVLPDEEDRVRAIYESSVDDIDNMRVVGEGKSFSRIISEAGLGEHESDIRVLFEASVVDRMNQINEQAHEMAAERVDEAVETMVSTLDDIVARSVGEWVSANEASIIDGIRASKAQRLAEGLRDLLESVGIDVPEESEDEVTSLANQLREANERADEAERIAEEASADRDEALRESAVAAVSADMDLSVSQMHKLEGLSESVYEDFESSVRRLAEAHFAKKRARGGELIAEGRHDDTVLDEGIIREERAPTDPVATNLRRGNRVVTFS